MTDCKFDISQLTDYGQEILECAKDFPEVTNRFLKSEAQTLARRAKRRAKNTIKEHSGKYVKGFKAGKKVYAYGDTDFNIQVKNTSSVGEFMENGHQMVGHLPDKNRIGYVPGHHILENATISYENEFATHVESKLGKKIEEALDK